MSAGALTRRIKEASPRLTARIAGVFYLLMMLAGGFALFARRGLVVSGDAAATASNILAHEPSFFLSFAAEILVVAFYLVVTALFYELFKPVNRSLSLLAALFGLAGCVIQAGACAFYLAPRVVLGGAPYLNVFRAEQLQALAFMFLKLYSQTYGIALVFFGLFDLLIGYLIFKSTFLPRTVGVLMMIAGLGGLAFLSPPFATKYFPYLVATFIGEFVLILWLIVKGVNVRRWEERAGAGIDSQ
ncbi:MAG TPA: DUF4386 domain-containing protein [Pyrinomonadaceae bacterium]|nr:DUF4386 domain-containing protein [Pyrinomonadaceae bacterium]